MWKGNRNTTTLLFSLKRLEIVHEERRGQMKTFSNGTLQRHPPPQVRTCQQAAYQPTNQIIHNNENI